MGFGTDLLGETHEQPEPRSSASAREVLTPLEILRAATTRERAHAEPRAASSA